MEEVNPALWSEFEQFHQAVGVAKEGHGVHCPWFHAQSPGPRLGASPGDCTTWSKGTLCGSLLARTHQSCSPDSLPGLLW